MIPNVDIPDPVILVPCGHTISQNDANHKTICPICAGDIDTTVKNYLLKSLREAFGDNISELLDCPITADPMLDPVAYVPCGHTFSRDGGAGLFACPACRDIPKTTVANLAIKNIVGQLYPNLVNEAPKPSMPPPRADADERLIRFEVVHVYLTNPGSSNLHMLELDYAMEGVPVNSRSRMSPPSTGINDYYIDVENRVYGGITELYLPNIEHEELIRELRATGARKKRRSERPPRARDLWPTPDVRGRRGRRGYN